MKINRLIKFTGKNLNDVFGLPCVKAIIKSGDEPILVLRPDKTMGMERIVIKGDSLIQYENGKWFVDR
jgi:hypothetical protein